MGKKESKLLEYVRKAQQGNEEVRNELIRLYSSFVLRVAASVCGRYLKVGEDDEASIALIAFNEAINNYNEERNVSFLSYSELLIRRRLVDYYRKERKLNMVVQLSSLESGEGNEEKSYLVFSQRQAIQSFQEQQEASERRAEIDQYKKILREYGITFEELVRVSPRHEDARMRAIEVGELVANCKDFRDYLLSKKELPLKQIEKVVKVSRRTLERQRKYIIAVSLILIYNFAYLKEYIEKV